MATPESPKPSDALQTTRETEVIPLYSFEVGPLIPMKGNYLVRELGGFAVAHSTGNPPLLFIYKVNWGFDIVERGIKGTTLLKRSRWDIDDPQQPLEGLSKIHRMARLVRWSGDFLKKFSREWLEYEGEQFDGHIHDRGVRVHENIIGMLHSLNEKGQYDDFFKDFYNPNKRVRADYERALLEILGNPEAPFYKSSKSK